MRPYPFVMHRRILASCSFVANVRCATDLARGSPARRDGNRMEGAMFSTRVSRRTLLKTGAIAGAGLLVPVKWLANAPPAAAFSQSQRLRKFIQPMRGVRQPLYRHEQAR